MFELNSTHFQENNYTLTETNKFSHIFSLIFICVHIFVAALAFIGNVFVCSAVACLRGLRGPYFFFVSSLAMANLLMVFISVLRVFLSTHFRKYIMFLNCHILSAVAFAVLCVILLHMSALCFERFLATKCTLRHRILITRTRLILSVFMLWIIGFMGSFAVQYVPNLFTSAEDRIYVVFHESFYHCVYDGYGRSHNVTEIGNLISHSYALILDVFYFLIPLTIVLVFFNYIYNAVCHQGERLEREANVRRKVQKRYQLKLARTHGIIVLLFLVFVLPQIVAAVYLHFYSGVLYSLETEKRMRILLLLSLAGSCGCLNPIVYVMEIKAFRTPFNCFSQCKRPRHKPDRTRKKLTKIELHESKTTRRSTLENGKVKLWSEVDRDLFC